jgi:MoaA/NifB/PqqE/SkfB family radical SAM enzyme
VKISPSPRRDREAELIYIFLGFACNNACVFCAQGAMRDREEGPPDVAALIATITPGETVAFMGGEPTVHDELPAWIAAADARGAARIVVQTNGRRLAYRAFTRALREASTKLALDVALQGASAAMHDYHTGTPGSFEQTVRGVRTARAERIPVGITTVVTRSNFRHLGEIARLAHTAGAEAIHFAKAEPFGRAAIARDRVVPAREMVLPYLTRAASEAQRLGLDVVVGARETGSIFAGIGEIEPVVEKAPPTVRKTSLPVLG